MRVCRVTHQIRVSLYLPATGLMRDSRLPPRAVLGPSFQHSLFPHKSCCVFSVQVHSVPCLSPTQTSPVPSASPCNVRTALFLPLLLLQEPTLGFLACRPGPPPSRRPSVTSYLCAHLFPGSPCSGHPLLPFPAAHPSAYRCTA